MPELTDLKFVRNYDFDIVPRYLLEQIPGREWNIDTLYHYGPLFISNPFNWLYVLVDVGQVIKGVLWATVDPVLETLAVNILSVDREYQQVNGSLRRSQSKIVKMAIDFLGKEIKKTNLKPKIIWTTTRPKPFELTGCKRSKRIVMEVLC